MKKMADIPEIDRPLNKAVRFGPAALSDTELIEALLVSGGGERDIRQISHDLINVIKDDMINKGLTYDMLRDVPGISPEKAVQILACYEIGRRYYAFQNEPARKITKPDDIIPLIAEYATKKQEHFICITINGAGEVLGNRIITMGLLNHSLVHPREVFADAITDRAASIIVAHNHPSGTLEPSSQDIAITTQLKEAGSIIGIPLLDHVIISKCGHLSMRERGLI